MSVTGWHSERITLAPIALRLHFSMDLPLSYCMGIKSIYCLAFSLNPLVLIVKKEPYIFHSNSTCAIGMIESFMQLHIVITIW